MFYVSGTKIYLATFDAELKAYPECRLVKLEDGSIAVQKQTKGIPKKPARRRVCSLTELKARFGALAIDFKLSSESKPGSAE